MILLALLMSWSPVVLDCSGLPEDFVDYEVSFQSWECYGIETEEPFCAVSRYRQMQDETWAQFFANANPLPGSGYWYEVRSHDLAGHWSDDCH